MQVRNLIKKSLTLMLLLILSNAAYAFAQSSNSNPNNAAAQKTVVVTEEFVKQAEITAAERDKYKAQAEAKTTALVAKDEQISSLQGLLKVQEQISSDWKEAALKRKEVIFTDEKIFQTYEKRITTLEMDLDKANRSKLVWGIVGFAFGGALGVLANRK